MTTRSDIISSMATGLSYLAIHDYDKALDVLQNIDNEIKWPTDGQDQEQQRAPERDERR